MKTKNTASGTPLEDTEASEDTLTSGRLGFIKINMLTTKLFILPMLNLFIPETSTGSEFWQTF